MFAGARPTPAGTSPHREGNTVRRSSTPLLGLVLALALPAVTAVLAAPTPAQASLTATNFIKADGKYLRDNSGTGDIVTLQGTNLGGWLTMEDWMSPLGEFALDRTGWTATASVNSSTAANALDGDNTTRWTSGTNQVSGQWFQIDLGTATLLNRVYVDAADFTGTYPAGYQVLVSSDASTWIDVASGAGSAQQLKVTFTPQVARYVRIAQTGTASAYWSVAEFNAFSDPVRHNGTPTATASATGSGYSTANALDGDVTTRWTSGTTQAYGQWFQVNLGANTEVNKILIDAGPSSTGDYPRGYEVWGSTDGTTFTKFASAYGTGRITVAGFWTTYWMQYIKIVQTGSSDSWWSIADLAVYSGSAFDRTGWTATASTTESGGSVTNVKDGNTATRWSTGAAQVSGQWLQVDMGAKLTFNQVVLDTAKNSSDEEDYPRGYQVQVSADGSSWTTVATGAGGRKATAINFPVASGRYLRIALTESSTNWWSVGELNVYLNNDDYDLNLTLNQRLGATTTASLINSYQDTWITSADLDNIAAMGMNMVRLPIGWTELLNLDGTWKSDAWTKIDWLVEQASARNIYVLLDLHTMPGGDCPWSSCGRVGANPNGFWTNTTYQDWVVGIWQAIATRYAGNPTIAGYDLLNEPLLDYSEDTDDIAQKSAYYERLYDAVRAIDADHTIFLAAFFSWDTIAQPSTYGWTNVAYELHPYDMTNGTDWAAQNSVAETQLAAVAAKLEDPSWSVPVLYGEYQLYQYDDVWAKFMSGLNALHVSWTNWNYKVRGDMYEGGGGYWGLYNSDANSVPILNSDTASTISTKFSKFGTSNFSANTSFIKTVKQFTSDESWMATVPQDETGWTASASTTESGGSAANALDWNTSTRWSSGAAQAAGQWFQVDLGAMRGFDEVSFETTSSSTWDYPRGYEIQVSADASTWTTVKTGNGFGWKQVITFDAVFARYVRIVQTGTGPDWWSIAEFHVFNEQTLSTTGWTATASATASGVSTANALDGSASTRWSTGSEQAANQWYQIDFGQAQTFNRVSLDSGTSTSDYSRGYQIQVSADASTWTTVASGTGSAAAILATFPVQVARYLKVVQTGTSTSWWSIQELSVYGELELARSGWTASASATESSGSVANALDGSTSTRWSTGSAQAAGQWYQIDLGSSLWFNHIVMDSGSSTSDYARDFIVQVSDDGTTWQTIANGAGTTAVVTVNVPIVQARYLRVTLDKASTSWWSIAELRVFE